MKFSELITKLHSASQPHMLMYIDIRSDCELVDVNILASGQSDVQAGTLYFADAGQLTPDTVLPTNLLYYGTLPSELADRLTNSAMIDRGEFAVLFQTVKELLSYQQSDQQLYTQVLYMLCNGAELDRVLTKMTDVTGDLFVVIDSTGKLVAKTKNFYVDYPLWMRSIEQGYCSDILMEYIEDRRRKNEYSLSDKPFTLFCEHMQRYLLCTRIVYDNFMMGYVIIVSKTGMFSAAEQQIIPLLSSSAKERIVKSNNGNWIDYRASQLNNIFADMLAGAQNVDMERRMKLAKLSFPEQKCLAIIRPVYYKEPAYYKSRLIPDMQAIFGKTAFSVVKNDLVLLLTAADGGTITPEQRAALEQYTQGHRLIVGISNCFQANNQLSLHYNMLLQTLQLAKQMRSDQKLFFFSDYVYYALLDQVEDKSLLSFIRHPALDTLIHYDREKSAELYQTLRVFTKCGFNKAHTSERLFLHRNTVNYRIAQIESICGIDLSTTELLFSLQLSFLIDGYLNSGAVDSVPMTMTVAAICGFAGVITNTDAFQSMITAITSISIAPILICWVVVALMCMLTGGSSTGQLVALPIIAPKLQALGLTASTIHRVSAFAATTLDSMPYSGSILMLLPMCHMKLKEVYPALFVTTVIATTVGTAAVTLMCVLFPGLA